MRISVYRRVVKVAAGLVLVAASAACGGSPEEASRAALAQGDQRVAAGSIKEAIVEYRKAVQATPQSAEARQKLADAYLKDEDLGKALPELIAAADLLPGDAKAQLAAGSALLLVGRFDDARGRAERGLALNPKDTEAQILLGNALAGLKDLEGAVAQIEAAIRTDPSRSMAYANLGRLQASKGDLEAAEATLKRAVFVDPKSVPAKLALANLYWATERRALAESTLSEALAVEPKNPLTNRALGYLYLLSDRVAEAETPLKILAENEPNPNGWLALADYYIIARRSDDAKAILERVAKDPAAEAAAGAKLRLASLGLWAGNREEAYRLINDVLATEPKNLEALVAKAQLQFEDKKLPEALTTSRAAVAANPASPQAQYVLGKVLSAQRLTDEAFAAHQAALQANPKFAPSSLELARLSMMRGSPKDAAAFAQEAIQAQPNYADAYLLLADALLAVGNVVGAERPLQWLAARRPDSPAVQSEIGRLLLAKGDSAGARAAFERALSKDAAELNALGGIIALELKQGRPAAARARVEAAMSANPGSTPISLLAARTYSSSGDDAAAERLLKQILERDAGTLEAYMQLASIYVRQQRVDEAIAAFDQHAEKRSQAIDARTAAAILVHIRGDIDAARARYAKVLQLNPQAPVAANNLAQIYSDRNENLDIALQLAQTAKAGLPDSHEVDDTLGWLCYKKKLSTRAIASLKQAVNAQPNNPIYLYHLGAAYAQNNEKANARQALEKALKIQPSFEGADDARRILGSLKN